MFPQSVHSWTLEARLRGAPVRQGGQVNTLAVNVYFTEPGTSNLLGHGCVRVKAEATVPANGGQMRGQGSAHNNQ